MRKKNKLNSSIIVTLIFSSLFIGLGNVTKVTGTLLPNGGRPGVPVSHDLGEISTEHMYMSGFGTGAWEYLGGDACPTPECNPLLVRGLKLKTNEILADYTLKNTIDDILLHDEEILQYHRNDCIEMDGPGGSVYFCEGNQQYEGIESVFLEAELIHAYVPLMTIHAEPWYEHKVELIADQTLKDSITTTTSLGFKAGVASVGGEFSTTLSESYTEGTGWPYTATGNGINGVDKYIYHEAYLLRIHGWVNYIDNSGIRYREYDFLATVQQDLADATDEYPMFGDFPGIEGDYYTMKTPAEPQEYIDLPKTSIRQHGEEVATSTTYSISFSGSKYYVSGSVGVSEGSSHTIEDALSVKHEFYLIPGAEMPVDQFYLRYHDSLYTDLAWDNIGPGFLLTEVNGILNPTQMNGIPAQNLHITGWVYDISNYKIPLVGVTSVDAWIAGWEGQSPIHSDIHSYSSPKLSLVSFDLDVTVPISMYWNTYTLNIRTTDYNGNHQTVQVTLINQKYWDSDRDGMSDIWEIRNYLNPYNSADRYFDSDGGGTINYCEYLSGSNPWNPADDLGCPSGGE